MRFSFNFQLPGNGNPFIFPTIAFGAVFWLIAVGVATALGLAMYALNGVGVSAMAKNSASPTPTARMFRFTAIKYWATLPKLRHCAIPAPNAANTARYSSGF